MAQAQPLSVWLAVAAGGGLGAVLRLALTRAAAAPWATLGVNLLGCFLLAALMHPRTAAPEAWRMILGAGLLGGFTTYSTFNLDILLSLREGRPERALAVAAFTVLGGLAAGAAGWATAERLAPTDAPPR